MAPRRTSLTFTSSLSPILDSTTFCFTSTPPETAQSRLLGPKLLPPSSILSLSPSRSSPRTHSENSFHQQFPNPPPPALAIVPPLEDDADESHSTTSSSSDLEYDEIFASSPIEYPRSGSPDFGFTSSPCTSLLNIPSLMLSPEVPSAPGGLGSKSLGLRESHVAGLYFMKPMVIGVKVAGAVGKSHSSKVDRGLDIQQVNKRASTPVNRTPTTRGRSSSSPVRIPEAVGCRRSISRHPQMSSIKSENQATSNIVRSVSIARSVPSSPVRGYR